MTDPNPFRRPLLTDYTDYKDVPLLRRSSINSALLLVGLGFPPALMMVCGTLVTGDIYYKRLGPDGTLRTWSFAFKLAALVILGAQVLALVLALVVRLTSK